MGRHSRKRRGRLGPLIWWALTIGWICVIWGHSLKTGPASDEQSYEVVDIVQRIAAWFALQDNPFVNQLLSLHPGIITRLSDPHVLNHYVRKGAHFTEYLVLGILVFNALRASLQSPLIFCLFLGAFWAGVPCADEAIQRYVPDRSGQLSDVLLDMSGFCVAVALCCIVTLIGALIHRPEDR